MTGMSIEDFDRRYRFRMVKAYPVISGVPDAYCATHGEIDDGFARCLTSRNLQRTHELHLAGREGPGPERPGPDYPPEWDDEPAEDKQATR